MKPQIQLKDLADLAGCTAGNIRRLHRAKRMPQAAGKIGQTYVWDDTKELRTWLATPRPGGRPPRNVR